MTFRTAALALCAAALACAVPLERRDGPSGFDWGNEKIRGVNIGGWLVLEPWITPSIFEQYDMGRGIVDEFTLTEQLGRDAALEVLRPHWDSWARFEDFQKIADSGFNLVRIPIGYWAYDNEGSPYAKGAAAYIDAAIDWARGTGLKVMIDLHGAPGSQNGFDNSGQKVDTPGWQSGNTVQKTLNVLRTMQEKYGDAKYDDVIAGVELLNEPLAPALDQDAIRQFTRDGYGQQRETSQSRVVVFQDGFLNPSTFNNFLTPSDAHAQNVAIDHHEYQVFTPELVAMEPWEHRQYVCNNAYVYSGADKWTFVGEWSAAMTDCAAALNGYGIGARYDGTYAGSWYVGSCAGVNDMGTWSPQFRDDVRGYIEAQLETFEARTQGWIFWNFKTERSPEWDAFRLLDAGLFPQPLTSRKFGAICESN